MDVPFVLPAVHLPPPARLPRRGRAGSASRSTRSASCARPAATASAPAGRSTGSATSTLPHGILASGTAQALVDVYQVWDNPDIADGLEVQAAPTARRRAALALGPPHRRGRPRDRADRPGRLRPRPAGPGRDPERGQPAARVRRDQPLRLQPLPRPRPAGDRPARQPRASATPARTPPAGRPASRSGASCAPTRSTSSPPAPASTAAGRTTSAAVSVDFAWGLTAINRALFDTGLGLPAQRVRPRLRRRVRRAPRRLRLPRRGRQRPRSSGRSPRPARSRSTPATGCARTGSCAGSGATTSPTDSNLRAGAGITYGNECAEFDLSVSRRYTSSDNVPPSTSIGFSLRLAGIGEKGQDGLAGARLHARNPDRRP